MNAHHLTLPMSCYPAAQEIVSICADYSNRDAVIDALVSSTGMLAVGPQIPCLVSQFSVENNTPLSRLEPLPIPYG